MDIYKMRAELNKGRSIYDLPLRVTFYARVSTGTDGQNHSLKNQVSYYSDFINQNTKWTYIDGYTDEALSGISVIKRESFLQMIADAKLGKFDFIVTKEISRFSRSTLDSVRFTQELLVAGVGVLFQSDNINTLMPDSELRLTIMSSIAQDEVRKISERVKFGFKRAIENGVVLGSSNIWGYTKEGGKLFIDERQAAIVRHIFTQYVTHRKGMRAICTWLKNQGYKNSKGNDFSFSTIKGILTNPKYKGYYCGNKTHKYDYRLNDVKHLDESEWVMYKDENNVPPIVSAELWDKANMILRERRENQSTNDTSYQNKYTYSGKIYCGKHKTPFYRTQYRYKSGNKEVWQCREYTAKGKAGCDAPKLYTAELDEILRDAYNTIMKNRVSIVHDLMHLSCTTGNESKTRERISKTKLQISGLIAKKDKLLDLSISGHVTSKEFAMRNCQLNQEIEGLDACLVSLLQEDARSKEVFHTFEALSKMMADDGNFHDSFDATIVDALLDRVEVHRTENKNEICLNVSLKILNEEKEYRIMRGREASF